MVAWHLKIGKQGEDLAADYLREKGWRLLVRNFRCRDGEVDLVFQDSGQLIFVEVKARSNVSRGEPGEAVTRSKKNRILRAAAQYLSQNDRWDTPCRFDLISILFENGRATLEHWEDIIDARDTLGRCNSAWQPW